MFYEHVNTKLNELQRWPQNKNCNNFCCEIVRNVCKMCKKRYNEEKDYIYLGIYKTLLSNTLTGFLPNLDNCNC